jgi:hypothetical protein
MEILTNPETVSTAEGTDSPVGDFSQPPCSEIPPPWHSLTGHVFRCALTGNMVIREGEIDRTLVVSEANELMLPTKPCAQTTYDSLAEKIHFPNQKLSDASSD